MTLHDDGVAFLRSGWRGKRFVVATAAIVFAGLAAIGALGFGYAVAGFAVVAAAAVLVMRAGDEVSRLVRPVAVSERTDDTLRALVAGLPDPVIALDGNAPRAGVQRPRAPRWRRRCGGASRCRWPCGCPS